MKNLASNSCSARGRPLGGAGTSNTQKAVAASSSISRATGITTAEHEAGSGQPDPKLPRSLDPEDLKFWAESCGTMFADTLIADSRWPRLRYRNAAIVTAGAIVDAAILGTARILTGDDFAPHIEMISTATRDAFWNSMPSNRGKIIS